ncbi:type II toxin-antitoxin system VapC family toxin [Gracilimonas mengyeensis]|uniref:Predicted nucleic acid-binding protein, contains PIN domain n=1 Tax=Gracilimonas mengyeensis TaxID=1302730 RepID=A0A521BU70_9BACT|nr:PIN domain-containing protein [Gracilimonas mengyeensis]SMO50722.1 Predicted nucleic acid-binding protein, contains PIN domain [Gracilimonas mengyeensis]
MAPKLLLDVNVCLDVLLDRKPFVSHSGKIFELGEEGKVALFISGLSFDTLFYVMRPQMGAKKSTDLLKLMLKHIAVAPVNQSVVSKALNANWKDLEDALQYYAALEQGCDFLISRNHTDFKTRELDKIKVLPPIQFLEESFNQK